MNLKSRYSASTHASRVLSGSEVTSPGTPESAA
ncbi:Protein of unknown function [Propionibacterium freudenreichii]|nr:Protein of unknown function [Propionibacterium freudenreichii]CEI49598.1 Protein of unknown function [Propionibacterium freudenreichii]